VSFCTPRAFVVSYTPDSGTKADVVGGPSRAKKRHYARGLTGNSRLKSSMLLDVLYAKLLGAPRQELIEFRLSGPDNLVLQYLY
jgi:hypothetical protein